MASSDPVGSKKDPTWNYAFPYQGQTKGTVCKFCNTVIKSGGITRFKFHLTGLDPAKNTRVCDKVPPEVQKLVKEWMRRKCTAKYQKDSIIRDTREEFRSGLSQQLNSEDEDEGFVGQHDVDPRDYKAAMRASRQSEWEREQGISRGVSGPGGTSRSQPKFDRSKSVRQEHGDQPQASFPQSLYKSNAAKQKSIIDSMSMGSLKEKLGRLCGKFFIYTNVPAYKAESHEYKNMIIGAQECPNVPPPSSFQIMNKYLPMEHKEITEYINSQRKMWKTYGCTIMADGWSGPTRMQVINFMVYCKGKTVFLKSVNASSDIREHKYLAKLFKDVIDEVGKENVVQICTDNDSAFVKAGKTLSERYNFYWTPCAAHCIDLMFEDIGKKKKVSDVITIARLVTVYVRPRKFVINS
ncbi:uncharacterized protein LOC133731650 [Rosa rugosa]|uniref:uncharacterized protein LOC133731650 n=1 Tax=Rosa rugosa TaxID=74645 RepID=UPI002B418653|nr:uncharacterized protein LOC133731650 [Rosa rugosa]